MPPGTSGTPSSTGSETAGLRQPPASTPTAVTIPTRLQRMSIARGVRSLNRLLVTNAAPARRFRVDSVTCRESGVGNRCRNFARAVRVVRYLPRTRLPAARDQFLEVDVTQVQRRMIGLGTLLALGTLAVGRRRPDKGPFLKPLGLELRPVAAGPLQRGLIPFYLGPVVSAQALLALVG